MRADGSLNLRAIAQQAALLRAQGVTGAFVCGTTGEGPSLSSQERMAVAEAWAHARSEDQALIVNVGHNSLVEAKALAAHAAQLPLDGIAFHPPNYFKPASVDLLIGCCALAAAAAPSTPFYYYHIPSLTGVRLPMPEFLRRGRERIPTLQGLKFSDPNLAEFEACLRLDGGGFDVLFGVDEMLLGALAMGGARAVGSTYNYAAKHYYQMMEAFDNGDLPLARSLAARAVSLCEALSAAGVVASGKACMALFGVDCGGVRPPLRTLTAAQVTILEERLRALSLLPIRRQQEVLPSMVQRASP